MFGRVVGHFVLSFFSGGLEGELDLGRLDQGVRVGQSVRQGHRSL